MRKLNKGRKFSRTTDQRRALMRTMANSFFEREKIETTLAKAKEFRPVVEKMITKAKAGGLSNTRLLAKDLSPEIVSKLVKEIAPKYKDRKGGYTRIVKLGARQHDSAEMAIFELVK